MLPQHAKLVVCVITLAAVAVDAEIITYSSNDPRLKQSLIVYGGTFDPCKYLDCRHGRCDPMLQECVCDVGWTGKLCDLPNAVADQSRNVPSYVYSTRQPIHDKVVLSKLLQQFNRLKKQKRNAVPVSTVRQRPRERLFVDIMGGMRGLNEARPVEQIVNHHAAKSVSNTVLDKPSENTFVDNTKYMTYESKPQGTTWVNVGFIGAPQNTVDDAPKTNFLNSPKYVTLDTDDVDSFAATSSQDVCSGSYQLRPYEDRRCQFGLRCMYGTCSSDYSPKQIMFQCKCDPGAMGLFCEQKCCLNCGQNGRCDVKPDGTQFCFCRRGNTGETCEIAVY